MLAASLLPLTVGAARLRQLRDEDATKYAEGVTAIAVRRFGRAPQPANTAASVLETVPATVNPGLHRGDLGLLTFPDAARDAFVGSRVVFDATADSAEVGFWLHPDHFGRGNVLCVRA